MNVLNCAVLQDWQAVEQSIFFQCLLYLVLVETIGLETTQTNVVDLSSHSAGTENSLVLAARAFWMVYIVGLLEVDTEQRLEMASQQLCVTDMSGTTFLFVSLLTAIVECYCCADNRLVYVRFEWKMLSKHDVVHRSVGCCCWC